MSYPWSANDILTASDLNDAIAKAGPPAVRSFIAKASGSDQTGISTVADITGCSVTWTADSSRIYKYTANVNISKLTTANTVTIYITNGSNTGVFARSATWAINDLGVMTLVWTESGLSGSTTRKLRAETATGTVTITNSFSRNAILVVEDIGPA